MKEYKDYAKITAHFDLAIEEAIKFGGSTGKHVILLFETMKNKLDAIPAADVVEAVRCKDCDVPHNRWIGCCYLNGLIPPPDFYCAYGKRKIDREE